jgi:hypothetical protein
MDSFIKVNQTHTFFPTRTRSGIAMMCLRVSLPHYKAEQNLSGWR